MGLKRNENGGWYVNGKERGTSSKKEYEDIYHQLKGSGNFSIRKFAKAAKISVGYAQKIKKEVESNGNIVPVETLKEQRNEEKEKGVGVFALTDVDKCVLLQLRAKNSCRTNNSYVRCLYHLTGTLVSSSFISTFFKHIGPYKGTFRKLNMVPIDKFKPQNIQTYADYLNFISSIPPHLLHFADEKSLKGSELYSRKGGADPETGRVDDLVVNSDFRNSYCIMGMMTINVTKIPASMQNFISSLFY